MLNPGTILQNRYRILSLLGQGGMGAVYRARDTRLDISVALKEMVPQPGLDPHTLFQTHRHSHPRLSGRRRALCRPLGSVSGPAGLRGQYCPHLLDGPGAL